MGMVEDEQEFRYGSSETCAAEWSTDYDAKEKACPDAGYKVPEIMFWDLAGRDVEKTTEAAYNSTSDRKGVVMMTGFSPAMLKVFIESGTEGSLDDLAQASGAEGVQKLPKEEIDLFSVMKKALMAPSFDGLVVVD
ncbi:hypothetical protein CPC08DRAFT_822674 [Agrocybe pediades]|nr:hypothetical protein CPC08DRAFT_822674 [Agrocybe pediades]